MLLGTIRALSDLRCRHRRALSDVFRFWSAQRGALEAEILAIEHGYRRYELLRTFIRVETAHIWQASGKAANS
jgi:hypothetical protein